jgi:hypothetical protein
MARWVCTRCTKLFQDSPFDRGPPDSCEHCANHEFDRIGEPRRPLSERLLSPTGVVRVSQAVVVLALLIGIINGFQRNFQVAAWGGAIAVVLSAATLLLGRRTPGAWLGNVAVYVLGLLSSVAVLGLIDWAVLPSVAALTSLNVLLFLAGLGILARVRPEFR